MLYKKTVDGAYGTEAPVFEAKPEGARFRLLYPGFRKKALTFSYDDGQIFDRRLVALFNKYGVKATFHLNSGTLDTDGFVTKAEVPGLYEGHEVACHGVYHEFPTHLPAEKLVWEFEQDRRALEACTGRIVRGCSYAYGEYDDRVANTLRTLGFAYCRTVNSTGGFRVPEDFLRWTPSCHHNGAFGPLADQFLNQPPYRCLALFYVWGHSFEFDRENTWDAMEAFLDKVHGHDDVWYVTNMDYVNYMNAARSLVFSMDGTRVQNLSSVAVYAEIGGKKVIL